MAAALANPRGLPESRCGRIKGALVEAYERAHRPITY